MGLVDFAARAQRFKRLLPPGVKRAFRGLLPFDEYSTLVWARQAPFPGIPQRYSSPDSGSPRLAILEVPHHWHQYYAAACRDLGVSYYMLDVFAVGGLVWAGLSLSPWKQLLDERLAVIDRQLGIPQFPDYEANWIYESKRRMHYWLAAHGFPQPRTDVFYRRQDAASFAARCQLPVVVKADIGACAQGVAIHRDRRSLQRAVREAFGRGVAVPGRDRRDRQWGTMLFQEFVPNAREWRMIRVGDSYFGYEKLAEGGFHSGTSQRSYVRPADELLDLTRRVTDAGRFTSMGVDVLLDEAGNGYITELQGVFGLVHDYACMVDGVAGRMLHEGNAWVFEAGDFCRNRMCNLRVEAAVRALSARSAGAPSGAAACVPKGRAVIETGRAG